MKKTFLKNLFAFLAVVCVPLVFVGCFGKKEKEEKHVHTYASEYLSDETHHWKEFTCGCPESENTKEEHDFVNHICRDCGRYRYEGMIEYELRGTQSSGYYYRAVGPFRSSFIKNVVIPDTYEGYPVTEIAESAFSNKSVESVTLGANVQKIGRFAFTHNPNLKSITIGNSVTQIGEGAFRNCTSLSNVVLSNSLTSIEERLFENCTSLTSITFPASVDTIKAEVFKGCTSLKNVTFNSAPTSFYGVFKECPGVESVVLPDGLETIGWGTFCGAENLVSVTIPSSVTSINNFAFEETNENLEVNYLGTLSDYAKIVFQEESSVPTCCGGKLKINGELIDTIDDSVLEISDYAFFNCDQLRTFNSASGLVEIGKYAFADCDNLQTIKISDTVETVGECAFYSTSGLQNFVVDSENAVFSDIDGNLYSKDKTTFIQYALGKTATSFVVPASVTNFAKYAFAGVQGIEEFTTPFIGENLDGTGNTFFGYIFGADSYLSNAEYVPETLRILNINGSSVLKANCLYGMSTLTALNLSNVTQIESDSFVGCESIETIAFPLTISGESLAMNVLEGFSSLKQVTFGSMADKKYKYPSTLEKIILLSGTKVYNDAFANAKHVKQIVLPQGIEEIEYDTFYNCVNLESIEIPSTVIIIGSSAFQNCTSLKSIEIPSGVVKIYGSTFKGCSGLQSVKLKGNVELVDNYAFYNCTKLEIIEFNNISALNTIGRYAFSGTDIAEFDASSATKICDNAFSSCSYLKTLVLPFVGQTIDSELDEETWGDYVPYRVENLTILAGKIPIGAFDQGFPNIKKISLGNGVCEIAYNAFSGCTGLEEIEIGEIGPLFIGRYAFAGCENLKKVNILSVESWLKLNFSNETSNPLFHAKQLYVNGVLCEELVVPNTITQINDLAFINCESLKKLILADSVTLIGKDAVKGCTNLQFNTYGNLNYIGSSTNLYYAVFSPISTEHSNICFSKNTKIVRCGAFADAPQYDYIDIADIEMWCLLDFSNDETLKRNPFKIGTKLYLNGAQATEIQLPAGLTNVGDYVFANVSTITRVIIPEGVETIGQYAFSFASGLIEIKLPASLITVYKDAFESVSSCTKIEIPTNDDWLQIEFKTQNSNPFASASSTAQLFVNGSAVSEFEVRDGRTAIYAYAFCGIKTLQKILIPDSVVVIGSGAFKNCTVDAYITNVNAWAEIQFKDIEANPINVNGNLFVNNNKLENLELSDVYKINDYAFYNCNHLKTVVGGSSLSNVGNYAFYNNTALTNVNVSTAKTIGSYSFAKCANVAGASSMNVSSATSIGVYAFYGCDGLVEERGALYLVSQVASFVDGSWRARDPNSTASADTYNGIVDNGEYFAYKMIIEYPGYQWTWL